MGFSYTPLFADISSGSQRLIWISESSTTVTGFTSIIFLMPINLPIENTFAIRKFRNPVLH